MLLAIRTGHAQPGLTAPTPVPEAPSWNVGLHLGPGYLYGDEELSGMSIAGRLELGRYLRDDIALQLTLGMNPPVSHDLGGGYGDGPTGRQSFFIAVVAEHHAGDFFAGIGAGAVRETTDYVWWGNDGLGPTNAYDKTYERFGVVGLARLGMEKPMKGRFFFTITLEALVMRLAATHDVMSNEWTYVGSLDIGVRYRW